MSRRRLSQNYYAHLARVKDEQAVDSFCDKLPENFFAVLVSNESSFAGLVLPAQEYGVAGIAEVPTISHSEVLGHPMSRESDTRIGALTASYNAYLGSLLTEQITEQIKEVS